MNLLSVAAGAYVSTMVWQWAADGNEYAMFAFVVMGVPLLLVQLVFLALTLRTLWKAPAPSANLAARRLLLWTAPAGLLLPLATLLLALAR